MQSSSNVQGPIYNNDVGLDQTEASKSTFKTGNITNKEQNATFLTETRTASLSASNNAMGTSTTRSSSDASKSSSNVTNMYSNFQAKKEEKVGVLSRIKSMSRGNNSVLTQPKLKDETTLKNELKILEGKGRELDANMKNVLGIGGTPEDLYIEKVALGKQIIDIKEQLAQHDSGKAPIGSDKAPIESDKAPIGSEISSKRTFQLGATKSNSDRKETFFRKMTISQSNKPDVRTRMESVGIHDDEAKKEFINNNISKLEKEVETSSNKLAELKEQLTAKTKENERTKTEITENLGFIKDLENEMKKLEDDHYKKYPAEKGKKSGPYPTTLQKELQDQQKPHRADITEFNKENMRLGKDLQKSDQEIKSLGDQMKELSTIIEQSDSLIEQLKKGLQK
jgi:hypothetical protein